MPYLLLRIFSQNEKIIRQHKYKTFRIFAKYKNKKEYIMAAEIEFAEDVRQIAEISKALSHPVRVYILKKLSGMNSCCYSGDLVEELPVVRSTLSEHLKVLKSAGLVQGEINPPYIKYCLNRKNWEKAKELLDNLFNETQSGDYPVCETNDKLPDRSE